MKRCPSCRRVLPDDAMLVCPYDGTPLLDTQINPAAIVDTLEDERGKASLRHPTVSRAIFGKNKKLLLISIALFVLISGTLLAVYIIRRSNCSEQVKITTPINLQKVDIPVTVKGTYQDLPQGQEIWILVYPIVIGRYYPQRPVEYLDVNRWVSSISVGNDRDNGKSFYIYAVLADEEAQRVLKDYMEQVEKTNDSQGMPDLVKGARICSAVTVTRN